MNHWRKCSLLIGCLAIAFGVISGRCEVINLTIAEALEMVEEGNLDLRAGLEQVEQSRQFALRDRSSTRPSVNLQASQGRAMSSFGIPDFDTGEGFVDSIHFNSFDAKIVAQYEFFNPVSIATYLAAKQGVEVAKLEYETAVQDILEATAQLCLSHMRNLERMRVIESNIERVQVALDQANAFYESGVGPKIDQTRARAQLALEKQSKLQQETAIAESGYAIKRILNKPLESELDLSASPIPDSVSQGPEVLAEQAVEGRPEYRQAENQLRRNVLETKAANFKRLPSLGLQGEWGYIGEELLDGDEQENWRVGIGVSVPIFESGNIKAEKHLAKSRLREQEYRIQSMKTMIESETRIAYRDTDSRSAQVEAAELSLELAVEELELARIRYEEGLGDNRELIEAQSKLADANDNVVEAKYQHGLARLKLYRSLGDVRGFLE